MAALHSASISPMALSSQFPTICSDSTATIFTACLFISVNVFYRINQEQHQVPDGGDPERSKQEREFKIGSIGFADSTGILLASILAVPTEIELCKAQVARGKLICKSL